MAGGLGNHLYIKALQIYKRNLCRRKTGGVRARGFTYACVAVWRESLKPRSNLGRTAKLASLFLSLQVKFRECRGAGTPPPTPHAAATRKQVFPHPGGSGGEASL